ncbi:MAG: ribosome maturation factor RimP [Cyclonatronaceae bacterium]
MVIKEDILSKIRDLVDKSIRDFDCYLIDIEMHGNLNNPTIWVYLESEKGGVSLDTCSSVSKKLSVLFEAHNLFDGKYRLNVSSPGLDKPLKDKRQYITNKGRKTHVKYRVGDEIKSVKGTLDSIEEDAIVVGSGKEQYKIALPDVVETKILPVF